MLPSPSYRAGIRNGFYLPVSIGLYCPVNGKWNNISDGVLLNQH